MEVLLGVHFVPPDLAPRRPGGIKSSARAFCDRGGGRPSPLKTSAFKPQVSDCDRLSLVGASRTGMPSRLQIPNFQKPG
jgi:hypothetical protein